MSFSHAALESDPIWLSSRSLARQTETMTKQAHKLPLDEEACIIEETEMQVFCKPLGHCKAT